QAKSPESYLEGQGEHPIEKLEELGPAPKGSHPEVVIAVGPAFGRQLTETINGLPHERVLQELLTGIAEEGLSARIVKVHHSADCAFIGYAGAQLSGSGVAIGLQSRGTTVIHRADLAPLNNLELFSQSPNLSLESYRQIGRNAARYAKREAVEPVPVKVDNWVRLRLIVKTMLLHRREIEQVEPNRPPSELHYDWEPEV
ncbi:MAG: propanediol dehydratase, partial [Chloroflexi bacterium]|nr:propanediol dehydratase [Chloroflexota bacterium]